MAGQEQHLAKLKCIISLAHRPAAFCVRTAGNGGHQPAEHLAPRRLSARKPLRDLPRRFDHGVAGVPATDGIFKLHVGSPLRDEQSSPVRSSAPAPPPL
jgi:hypothetical protein